jgi:hypothetical protein
MGSVKAWLILTACLATGAASSHVTSTGKLQEAVAAR